MKTYLDCLPCFMNQALRAGRMATNDERVIRELLDNVAGMIKDIPSDSTPPETGELIYRKVTEITSVEDPYREIKKNNISEALEMYPYLKSLVENSDNKLLTAIRIAIAGNVIDFGTGKDFNITDDLNRILNQDFAILDIGAFTQHLSKADTILYLGDNAGESVFDRILIESMGKTVTFATREAPVINDVTMEDAVASGLGNVSNIMSSGCKAPGIILEKCNRGFIRQFRNADMVIAKGQGNYEGLSHEERPVFFLLKAKCRVIANDLDVDENDIVLKLNKSIPYVAYKEEKQYHTKGK